MINIGINEKGSGGRIDKFLAGEFFSYSRGEIAQFIKDGYVTVNKCKVEPKYVLKNGDIIETDFPEKNQELFPNHSMKLDIIYSDVNIIVVNKPAGVQVHPSHTEKENTLVNALIVKFPEIAFVGDGSPFSNIRPGVVHRLDKDTSGVMVFARNQGAFNALKAEFKARKVMKRYIAIAHGILDSKHGIVHKGLAKSSNYKKQVIANEKTKTTVREAITEYRVIKETGEYSLVEALPKTGRMHQIRVHLAYLGHPIAGDQVYGKRQLAPDSKSINAERQMLHASRVEFQLFGKDFSFSVPLSEDFARCWEVLTKR